jgi:hypothetical protein
MRYPVRAPNSNRRSTMPRKRKAVEAHTESHQQPAPHVSAEPVHQAAPETAQPVEVPTHENSGATHAHGPHEAHGHGTHGQAAHAAPSTEVAGAALHGHAPHEGHETQHATGEARKTWQPDPFALMTVPLGKGHDAPRMTLFRNNRYQQMAIRFDQKPAEHHRVALHAAGWLWREAEGVWTKQLDRDRRAASQLDAERLFHQLADAIRAELGLVEHSGPG